MVQPTCFEGNNQDDIIITIDDDFQQTGTSFNYSIREEDNETTEWTKRNRIHYVAVFDQL